MKKVLLILLLFFLVEAINTDDKQEKTSSQKYVEGYLIKQATWAEDFDDVFQMNKLAQSGKIHSTSKPVKIEIWDLNDRSIVMIYFLEGRYKGRWGYTTKGFVTTKKLLSPY